MKYIKENFKKITVGFAIFIVYIATSIAIKDCILALIIN